MSQSDRINFCRSISDSKERRKLLLETGELADCTIRVSEEQALESSSSLGKGGASSAEDESTDNTSSDIIFSCHKMVLATASEVFERMFFGDFKGDIRITDISPEIFKAFLKYVYTYELDPNFVTVNNFKELMYVADKYMVGDFSSACIEILKNKSWDIVDIFPIFEVACFYENITLLSLSYEKICTHGTALLKHWTFYDLDVNYMKRLMVLLTQYNELKSTTLLDALERYGKKNRCSDQQEMALVDAAFSLNFTDLCDREYALGPNISYLFRENQNESDNINV